MSFFALYHPFVLLFLKFAICCNNAEVQAQKVVPLPGWFNSVEGFLVRNHLSDYRGSTESSMYFKAATENREDERRSKKARRKRKKVVKKVMTRFENSDSVPKAEIFEIKSLKKRKRNRKGKKTFVKALDEQNVESNLSESHEKINKSRIPVDIIVHIKMNE